MTLALGTETGSVVNHVLSRQTKGQSDPKVGMGATLLGWTDRYAGTIIDVTGNIVTVQEDRAKRTNSKGMSDDQTYVYEGNPDGAQHHYQLRDSEWVPVQWNDRTRDWNKSPSGYPIKIGVRDQFHDFTY